MAKIKVDPGGKYATARSLWGFELEIRRLAEEIRKGRLTLTPELIEELELDKNLQRLEDATRGRASYKGKGVWEGEQPGFTKTGFATEGFAPDFKFEREGIPQGATEVKGTKPRPANVAGYDAGIHQVNYDELAKVDRKIAEQRSKIESITRDMERFADNPKKVERFQNRILAVEEKIDALGERRKKIIVPKKPVKPALSQIVDITDRVTREDKKAGVVHSFRDDLKVVSKELNRVSPVMPTGAARQLVDPFEEKLRSHLTAPAKGIATELSAISDYAEARAPEGFSAVENTAASRARASINRVLDPKAQAMVDAPGLRVGQAAGTTRKKKSELGEGVGKLERKTKYYRPGRQLAQSFSKEDITRPVSGVGTANFQSAARKDEAKLLGTAQDKGVALPEKSVQSDVTNRTVHRGGEEGWRGIAGREATHVRTTRPPVPTGSPGPMPIQYFEGLDEANIGVTRAEANRALRGDKPLTPNQKSALSNWLKSLGKGVSTKALMPVILALGLFGMMGKEEGLNAA
tara:strand:+ start:715 stop:2277 length:1563 start_codon:yes stop_codon:yes gene_type:complete